MKMLESVQKALKYFKGIHKHSFDNLLKELVGDNNGIIEQDN